MKRLLVVLLSCLALAGCVTTEKPPPPPTADRVDLDRFMGDWYVIATTPGLVDGKAYNSRQTFARAQRGFTVTYTFNKGEPTGEQKTYTSSIMVDNPGINSMWTVQQTWPFKADHRVLHLEPDYSVAVIGSPDRKDVRILSRQPRIRAPLYSDLVVKLQNLGYDISAIRRIPHN